MKNINQALGVSLNSNSDQTATETTKDIPLETSQESLPTRQSNTNSESLQENNIPDRLNAGETENNQTSSEFLDQLIKNIIENTEKEPSFDSVIQEVIEVGKCNLNTNINRFERNF